MRIRWELCVVTATVTGLMLGSYLSQPQPQQILRGVGLGHPFVLPTAPTASGVPETQVQIPVTRPKTAAVNHKIEVPPENKSFELNAPLPPSSSTLNLSLPEGWDTAEWKKPVLKALPDFFKEQKHSAATFDYSTKLHWDESEEARTKPIEKTIEGAELELQFKLP